MRYLLLPLSLLFTSFLSAQSLVDTVWLEDEGLAEVFYRTEVKDIDEQEKKAANFMRGGLSPAEGVGDGPFYRVDSSYTVAAGARRGRTNIHATRWGAPRYQRRLEDGSFEDLKPGELYLTGETVIQPYTGKREQADWNDHEVVRVRRGASVPSVGANATVRVYDIYEADFHADAADYATFTLPVATETLSLSLRGTEKMMQVFTEDGELFRRITIGRDLEDIAIYGWPCGRYRLEVIDLRTREKRSAWVVRH